MAEEAKKSTVKKLTKKTGKKTDLRQVDACFIRIQKWNGHKKI